MVVSSSSRSIWRPVILVAGFLTFLYILSALTSSPASADSTLHQRQQDAVNNPLSPPTKPLRNNQIASADGRPVPPPVVRYPMNNVTATANAVDNEERVLILTPLAKFYPAYWENLKKLTYPRHLVSLAFVVPKTPDGNAASKALENAVSKTQSGAVDKRFASVTILRHGFESPAHILKRAGGNNTVHEAEKRKTIALARNSLLSTTIGPSTSWVLWMDGDIVRTPHTLIQDLTKHDKGVIVPNTLQRFRHPVTRRWERRPYDVSSWIDSETAHGIAQQMGPNQILMEGFSDIPTQRILLAQMANLLPNPNTNAITKLHSVGSKVLLVKADVHRDGAMFPAFPFYHLIESEGFARMAGRLGWESWGLPNYFVSV